ncbi:uncharacterized protein NEMAJ01_2109 [Nematocida major]|uniref:uncharacterized protein n=1 Tax=Nematocida major TaxID=1912982 RepID=UPI002007540A|nr:uncharacterized protein NEMAJ01_2109 [Nematocida major]KAH9387213.1 hypothetical protein NEMAJ01_2109 [Nematocida major]
MANAEKVSSEGDASGLIQKEGIVEKVAISDELNLMHGWRFVPDEIELKKRVLYALTVGFKCLSTWVYKQIIPYVDTYGLAEFEASVFPRLLKGQTQSKYALTEIRQEIERNILVFVKRAYGENADIFLARSVDALKISRFKASQGVRDAVSVRMLYYMLRLLIVEIEESDIRTIELIVFLGQALDRRILDYLVSYFYKEKDLLLEILLVKMRHRKLQIPEQMHLRESEVAEIFQGVGAKLELSPEEEEKQAKEIVMDISNELDITYSSLFMLRALMYVECIPDTEILQKMTQKMESKNKAVRMECIALIHGFAGDEDVCEALMGALQDPDDDVKRQAQMSLSMAVPIVTKKQSELIEKYSEWFAKDKKRYAPHLPSVLIAAKKAKHEKHGELYREYCTLLEKAGDTQRQLARKVADVFGLYIQREDVIAEDIVNLKIEDRKNALTFPSPDIAEFDAREKKEYSPENAVCDLERVMGALVAEAGSAEKVVEMLPLCMHLLRAGFVQKMLLRLFERDPERNWRYWMRLLQTADKVKDSLTERAKASLKEHIKKLTAHWAHAVRIEAKKMDSQLK